MAKRKCRTWDQFSQRIDKAEARIREDIKTTQVIFFSPERIVALFPDGYDLSKLSKFTGTVATELRVIGGVFT